MNSDQDLPHDARIRLENPEVLIHRPDEEGGEKNGNDMGWCKPVITNVGPLWETIQKNEYFQLQKLKNARKPTVVAPPLPTKPTPDTAGSNNRTSLLTPARIIN